MIPGKSKKPSQRLDLSPAERKELLRRIRDANDPRRYLLASVFTPRFVLYYNVESDAYVMNDAEKGTAFKSLRAAKAVLKTLGKHIALIPAKRRKDGSLQVGRQSVRAAVKLEVRGRSSR